MPGVDRGGVEADKRQAAAAASRRAGAPQFRPQQERSAVAAIGARRRSRWPAAADQVEATDAATQVVFKFPRAGQRRQRPHALDPDHRPPGAGAAAGALSGRDRGAQSAGRDPAHQRRRQRPAARHHHDLRARQGGLRRLCRRCPPVGLPGRRDAAAGLCARREDHHRARRRPDRPHRHRHDRAGCAAPVAHHPPDHDLSRARPGQGAAPAGRRAAPRCRAGRWSSPTPRASS